MALNGAQLGNLILSQSSARGIVGSEMPRFSLAMGMGIVESFLEMNKVNTIDTGVMTVGKGTGKMSGIIPSGLTQVVVPLLMGNGILGTRMKGLAEAVCYATAMHLNSANTVETTHSTVALGSGVGKVLNLIPSKMESRIMQKMSGQNYNGIMLNPLVRAFSMGFCQNIMATAIVNVVISGSPAPLIAGSPVPSGGSGVGKVL